MYAGTTFRRDSGRIIGVHQRIDRASRRQLKKHISDPSSFPSIAQILHFEGVNGPDGIKRKSPSKDEPWHFINPADPSDESLMTLINDHIHNLATALKDNNTERAAFEAAWLAHAVVDGLTPAHHYPLNDKIEELWGKPHTERLTTKDKAIIKGVNRRDTMAKNWEYWGFGGVFSAHLAFEAGVASAISGQRFGDAGPSDDDITYVESKGFEAVFRDSLNVIDGLKMYQEFGAKGWTRRLARQTRQVLLPEIIKSVCLAWYYSLYISRGNKI